MERTKGLLQIEKVDGDYRRLTMTYTTGTNKVMKTVKLLDAYAFKVITENQPEKIQGIADELVAGELLIDFRDKGNNTDSMLNWIRSIQESDQVELTQVVIQEGLPNLLRNYLEDNLDIKEII